MQAKEDYRLRACLKIRRKFELATGPGGINCKKKGSNGTTKEAKGEGRTNAQKMKEIPKNHATM
jgi:hypothetical protein